MSALPEINHRFTEECLMSYVYAILVHDEVADLCINIVQKLGLSH